MSEPPGSSFAHRIVDDGILIAAESSLPILCAEGLDRLDVWQHHTRAHQGSPASPPPASPGRGETSVVALQDSTEIRLKQLRRGGLLASLWRERFLGTSRLVSNLEIPAEASRRGIPTPAAVALFLVPGPPAFYRGWLATEEIQEAIDLWRHLEATPAGDAPTAALRACGAAMRKMHDAGLDHPDLNIGNLLIKGSDAFVIDLDKAKLDDRPVGAARRRATIDRLERSYRKHLRPSAMAVQQFRATIVEAYCGDDARLRQALASG